MEIRKAADFEAAGLGGILPFTLSGTARPETWGPPIWDALVHIINAVGAPTRESFEEQNVIFALSQEEVEQLVSRLESFSHLIPCPKCAGHFRDALSKVEKESPAMRTRAGWLDWITRQKDAVNRLNGKPIHSASERAAFVRDIINLTPQELAQSRRRAARGGVSKKKGPPPSSTRRPDRRLHILLSIVIILVLPALIYIAHRRGETPRPQEVRDRQNSLR